MVMMVTDTTPTRCVYLNETFEQLKKNKMYTEKEFVNIVRFTPGVKIIHKIGRIYLLSVKYQSACASLFDIDTVYWCIARSEYQWKEYITNRGNKQYFIVDFNNINNYVSHDEYNFSFIGFTVDNDGNIYAAHARNDKNLLTERNTKGERLFERILKKKGLYDFVINDGMKKKEKVEEASMIPVYFLIGAIILASLTLFIR